MQPQSSIHHFLNLSLAAPMLWLALTAAAGTADMSCAMAPGDHLTGGIGVEERMQMHEARGRYNLQLVFAQARTGAYLSAVTVSIKRVESNLALGPHDGTGPWFPVPLDPGTYRVSATDEGVTQTRTVRVGRALSERVLSWPAG